jgi:hypothetical protein
MLFAEGASLIVDVATRLPSKNFLIPPAIATRKTIKSVATKALFLAEEIAEDFSVLEFECIIFIEAY